MKGERLGVGLMGDSGTQKGGQWDTRDAAQYGGLGSPLQQHARHPAARPRLQAPHLCARVPSSSRNTCTASTHACPHTCAHLVQRALELLRDLHHLLDRWLQAANCRADALRSLHSRACVQVFVCACVGVRSCVRV
eukprot:361927-Chlamydomonas_euryale.AAC.12